MYPGANQDGRPPMTPTIDDPASVAHPSDFLPEPGGGSSEEDSSSQSPPSPPPRRRRDRQKHVCEASGCTMKFDRPSALKQHLLSHTGEKPHHCDVCGRGFSTASNMRRHIPSCPVRRRLRAPRTNQDGHLAPPGSSFASLREPAQTFEPGWPSSSASHWGSGFPPSSTPRAMSSPTPGVQSPLPSPYTPNDGFAWRQTNTPDAQHEASFQASRPFLEPSYSPHPPTWPPTSRTPYELGPLPRPSPSDTILPRESSSMQWSPGPTIGVTRDSQSRFGSTEDFRSSSTPVQLQRYSSDFPSQLHLPDRQLLHRQSLRSQMSSSDTTLTVTAGSFLLNAGASTTVIAPVQPEPQPIAYTRMERMDYPTKRRNRPQAHGQWSPGQGSSFWSSYSPTPQPDPRATGNNAEPSARERSDMDHEPWDDKQVP